MKQENDNRFWDSFAGKYDKFIANFANETYVKLLKLMEQEISLNSKVLEIGTGTGIISFAIADKVKSITAIDYAPEMIKLANSKLVDSNFNNIEFKVNSATNIEQQDKSFDVIIACNIFHLLPEPEKTLEEIIRLLTDNGKVILPTYCHGQNIKTRFISGMMSLSGFKAVNKWSLKLFRKFVEYNGLTIEKEEIIKDKIPLSFIVASKN
jgi:ubiquinone/menaquinone biosynthesis C-methylase UbiE